jgi:hypothetical protein
MGEERSVCLQAAETRCIQDSGRFNTFETENTLDYPQGDIMNTVARGMVSPVWNLGLRNPQAKKLTIDHYNGGCITPAGCVPDISGEPDGFRCFGSKESFGKEITRAYNYLNAPLLADGFEYTPPSYMQGIKVDGPNAATGWERPLPGLPREFETVAGNARKVAFAIAGVSEPQPRGCGQ